MKTTLVDVCSYLRLSILCKLMSGGAQYGPEPAEFEVVGGLDLLDLVLEAVDGLDERRAVLAGPAAQLVHLGDDVSETVVETDHVLLVGRGGHEQAAERVRAADVLPRRTSTANERTANKSVQRFIILLERPQSRRVSRLWSVTARPSSSGRQQTLRR